MKTKIYVFGAVCTALVSLLYAGTNFYKDAARIDEAGAQESVSGTLEMMGQITAVGQEKISLTVDGKGEVIVILDNQTGIRIVASRHVSGTAREDCVVEERTGRREDLRRGLWIRVFVIVNGSGYHAQTITLLPSGFAVNVHVPVTGKVESVDTAKKALTIVTYNGERLIVHLDRDDYHQGGVLDLATIKAGTILTIIGEWRGDGALSAVTVLPVEVSLTVEAEAGQPDAALDVGAEVEAGPDQTSDVDLAAGVAITGDPKDICPCGRSGDGSLEIEADAEVEANSYSTLEKLSAQIHALLQLGD